MLVYMHGYVRGLKREQSDFLLRKSYILDMYFNQS
jgi:hypothetical protein